MQLKPDVRDEDIEDLYLNGACHIFALAVSEECGAERFLVVMPKADAPRSADLADAEVLSCILHVYAVLDLENGPVAIDVTGGRKLEHAEAHARELFGEHDTASILTSREELVRHSIENDEADGPGLSPFSGADLVEARAHFRKMFPSLGGREALVQMWHATTRCVAQAICQNGFMPGWGDDGLGVYLFGNRNSAEDFAARGGWDFSQPAEDMCLIEVFAQQSDIRRVDIHPCWEDPEDYSDVWVKPSSDEFERWRPMRRMAEISPREVTIDRAPSLC